jgi:transposase-like protein
MRLTAQEKQEIIDLVEGSDMSIERSLQKLGIAKSTFFKWYKAYRDKGLVGLTPMPPGNRPQWNTIRTGESISRTSSFRLQ